MKAAGFEKEVKKVKNKICPHCNELIDESSFRDELSEKEYTISGLCQTCQDEIFGE
jgi:hypothetical protein